MRRRRLDLATVAIVAAVVIFYGAVLVAGLQGTGTADAADAPQRPGATIEELGIAIPDAARGQELSLLRLTLPPGGTIAPERHPETRVAWIVSGELAYSVIAGEVALDRYGAVGSRSGTQTEIITAGLEVILRAGSSIVEGSDALHAARNIGTEPVVLLLATLSDAEQPRSVADPTS